MIINYLKNIGYVFLILLLTNIIVTILNYFNILNGSALNIFSIVTMLLSLFTGGYLTGKKANKKGYLEGIKFGLIIIGIILIFNLLIFRNEFNIISILYYLSLLVTSTIGSMIGIQRKSN